MSGFMNPAEFVNIRQSEENFWWYRGMRAGLFRMLEPHLKGRAIASALEAGCGTGYLSQLLQRDRGWPIVPLDFSGDGLRYARELGVRNAVQGDIRCLPFGDGEFDLVLSVDVLAHLPRGDEHPAAREMARVITLRLRVPEAPAAFTFVFGVRWCSRGMSVPRSNGERCGRLGHPQSQ